MNNVEYIKGFVKKAAKWDKLLHLLPSRAVDRLGQGNDELKSIIKDMVSQKRFHDRYSELAPSQFKPDRVNLSIARDLMREPDINAKMPPFSTPDREWLLQRLRTFKAARGTTEGFYSKLLNGGAGSNSGF